MNQAVNNNWCPTLYFTRDDLPVLHTDTSDYGIGAYLFQFEDATSTEFSVAFLSKSLSRAERNWSIIDKEAFAIYSNQPTIIGLGVMRVHKSLVLHRFDHKKSHKDSRGEILSINLETEKSRPFPEGHFSISKRDRQSTRSKLLLIRQNHVPSPDTERRYLNIMNLGPKSSWPISTQRHNLMSPSRLAETNMRIGKSMHFKSRMAS